MNKLTEIKCTAVSHFNTIQVKHDKTWVRRLLGSRGRCHSLCYVYYELASRNFPNPLVMATRLWATVCIVVLVTAEPIKKRVNWFVSPGIRAEQSKFLLGSRICDGVYTCCGGASFLPNGTGHEFLYFAFFISKFSTTPKLVRRQTCLWTNFVQIKSLNWYKHSRSATPAAQHNSAAAISRGRSACNVHLGRRCVAAGRMGKKERDCRANIKLGSEI